MTDLCKGLVMGCVMLASCAVPRDGAGPDETSSSQSGGADDSGSDSGTTGGTTMSMTTSTSTSTSGSHDTDDPSTTSTGSDDGSDGSSSGAPEMPCEGTCAPTFEGWHGPAVALRGVGSQPAPQCEGEFGTELLTAWSDVTADVAVCECSCGAAEGTDCGDGVTIHRYTANCVALQDTYVVGANCLDIPNLNNPYSWRVETPSPQGGACDVMSDVELPEPQFLDAVRLCGAEAAPAGTCDEGQCVATPSDEQGGLCYWLEGEHECPMGERTVLLDGGYSDMRGCTECGCGEPAGECVFEGNLVAGAFGSSSCANALWVGLFAPEECTPVEADVYALQMAELPTPDVACEPSGGQPTGDIAPTGLTTMCCIE